MNRPGESRTLREARPGMEEEGLRRPAPPFSREHLQSRRGPQGGCVQTPASGRVLGGGAEVRAGSW